MSDYGDDDRGYAEEAYEEYRVGASMIAVYRCH